MRAKTVVSVLLLALLLVTSVARAAPSAAVEIARHVLGGGGGRAEQTPYVLNGTFGQPLAGSSSQTSYALCAGFWCDQSWEYKVYLYLPLAMNEG